MKKSLIIPAFNEEQNIENVLKVSQIALNNKIIDEIIVIDDGSKIKLTKFQKKYGFSLVEHSKNLGKGAALDSGIKKAKGDIILFLDADLVNLDINHIKKLLGPIKNNLNIGMVVGTFSKSGFINYLGNFFYEISGQRAVRKNILNSINGLAGSRYGADILITNHIKKSKMKIENIKLTGLSQTFKESKGSLVQGIKQRILMYRDILRYIGR